MQYDNNKMMTISGWEENTRWDVIGYISDDYKDLYGSRPRGYDFSKFSDMELVEFYDEIRRDLDGFGE